MFTLASFHHRQLGVAQGLAAPEAGASRIPFVLVVAPGKGGAFGFRHGFALEGNRCVAAPRFSACVR